MITLHIEHPITDYGTWRTAFDALPRPVSGRRHRRAVARPIDDPRYIVVALDFDSLDHATSFRTFLETQVWASPLRHPVWMARRRPFCSNPPRSYHRGFGNGGTMAKTDFKSVDEYIATQPEDVRPILQRVRSTIRKAVPDAEEVISYQIPAYKLDGGAVLYFAGWKQHYSLYPATDRPRRDVQGRPCTVRVVGKGTIRFPLSQPVPVKLIERIAKFRAKEAAERAAAKSKTPRSASRSNERLRRARRRYRRLASRCVSAGSVRRIEQRPRRPPAPISVRRVDRSGLPSARAPRLLPASGSRQPSTSHARPASRWRPPTPRRSIAESPTRSAGGTARC